MIVRVRGQLTELTPESAVVDRDGIAYEIMIPGYVVSELAPFTGREITLHTLEYLEGSAAGGNLTPRLIGFLHSEDRGFFRQFITVKGVGMRKALKALAEPVGRIASYIESGEAKLLSKLPGIGKRMADQIVAELRGKVSAFGSAVAAGLVSTVASDYTNDQRAAIEILVAWGDSRSDAQRWIAHVGQGQDKLSSPEDWVRAAYKVRNA